MRENSVDRDELESLKKEVARLRKFKKEAADLKKRNAALRSKNSDLVKVVKITVPIANYCNTLI